MSRPNKDHLRLKAARFIYLWKQEKRLEAERKALGLDVLLEKASLQEFSVGKETVAKAYSTKREITLKLLQAHFGDVEGRKFWDTVDPKTYSWLTVKTNDAKAAVV